MQLPLGWWTDLEVLRRSGSTFRHRPDHIVVRTAANPEYWWGNFVLMTGPRPADECLALFREAFPDRTQVAIGMLWQPDPADWAPLPVGSDSVLVLGRPPAAAAVPGYEVRPLTGDDWEQSWRNETRDLPPEFADYARRRMRARRGLVEAGDAAWIGAFHGEALVAELGIVVCGDVARYQDVATVPEHRRRGLASHLLTVAGRWAQRRGAQRWVILTDPGSDAERLYRSLGFSFAESNWQIEAAAEPAGDATLSDAPR